jgi:regulator of protease activity HflC (stomatin/prohibitin superfamily)
VTSLADFLEKIADRIGGLFPVRVIREWEQGVRLFAGRIDRRSLTHANGLRGTGVHFFWPLLGEVVVHQTNIDVVEAPPQTSWFPETGEEGTYSLAIRYRVHDAAALYAKVYDDETSLVETCRSAASVVAQRVGNLREFAVQGPGTDGLIAKEARAQMHGWGVEILRVQLVNLTRASVVRLIQDVAPVRQKEE